MEDEIDRLYGLDLKEFIAARDELARSLRRQGRKDAAARVKALAKPVLSAWVVNQLQRREASLLETLYESSAEVRDSLKRGAGASAHQSAMGRRREALAALVNAAGEILREHDHPAGAAQMQRIERTLEALAARGPDDEAARGRLTQDLEPPGFDALVGLSLPPAPRPGKVRDPVPPAAEPRATPPSKPGADPQSPRGKAPPRRASSAAKERQAKRLAAQRALEAVQRQNARLRLAAEKAAAEVQSLEAEEAEARAQAEEAKRQAEAAQRRSKQCSDKAQKAREKSRAAAQAAAQCEAKVKDAQAVLVALEPAAE